MPLRLSLLVFVVGWLGCGRETHEHVDPAASAVRVAAGSAAAVATSDGKYQIAFTTEPTPIPLAGLFAINAVLTDSAGVPVTDAGVAINARMPQHGHGMSTKPENLPGTCDSTGVCIHPEGKYRTEGMKFHMPGDWTVDFVVSGPAGDDTLSVVVPL